MKETRKNIRAFLNKEDYHSTAAVCFSVSYWHNSDNIPQPDGEIEISDCSRTITLDLGMDDEAELDNSIYKLKTLSEVCLKGIEMLESERELVKGRPERDKKELEKIGEALEKLADEEE